MTRPQCLSLEHDRFKGNTPTHRQHGVVFETQVLGQHVICLREDICVNLLTPEAEYWDLAGYELSRYLSCEEAADGKT